MGKKGVPFILAIVALGYLLSCSTDDNPTVVNTATQDSTILEHLELVGNDSATRNDNGIYSYPITLNPGAQSAAGQVVSIHYTAQVLGGQVIDIFDENDGDTLLMRQGVNAIYPVGLDFAIGLMNEGETYGFIIPSSLAYDTLEFSTLIPANSIIEFTVEIREVQLEAEINAAEVMAINQYIEDAYLDSLDLVPLDSVERVGPSNSVIYKRLAAGSPGTGPRNGQLIAIAYEARFMDDSVVFDTFVRGSPFDYPFNSNVVIPGLDIGIAEMEFNERALIIIPSFLGYRESAVVVPDYLTDEIIAGKIVPDYVRDVGPYRILAFEVTLLGPN